MGARLPTWAAGTPITRAHLSSIEQRAKRTVGEARRLLPGSRGSGTDTMLVELRHSVEVLCGDVSVLLTELRKEL